MSQAAENTTTVASSPVPTASFKRGIWYLSDVVYKRLKLFEFWEILGFAAAVLLTLALVFSHNNVLDQLAENEKISPNDSLTLEYLRVFLQADPNNHALRLPLAKRLVRLGYYIEARQVLSPLYKQGNIELRDQAEWIELEMLEQERFAMPEDSLGYPSALAKNLAQLRVLLNQKLNAEQLVLIGKKAQAANDNQIALAAFRRLLVIPHLSDETYATGGAALVGLGEYRGGAEMYFFAMKMARTWEKKREYFFNALRALQAASLFTEALEAAEHHLKHFSHDTETLMFLARLAQAGNRPDLAMHYAGLFLQISPTGAPGLPFNQEAYALGIEILQSTGNLDEALRVAKEAVARFPDSAQWRKRLAQLNDWTGNSAEALKQWLVYARLSGDEPTWDKVMLASKQTNDLDVLQEALEHKTNGDPKKYLDELLELYDRIGRPDLQITKLQELFDKSVDEAKKEWYLQKQADVYEFREDITHALERTELLQKTFKGKFGHQVQYAKKLAIFYTRKNRLKDAFIALHDVRDSAPKNDTEFWHNYAELGGMNNEMDAEDAFRVMLEADIFTETDLTNLMYTWTTPDPRAAAKLAKFAFFNAVRRSEITLNSVAASEFDSVARSKVIVHKTVRTYPTIFAIAAMDLSVKLSDWEGIKVFLAKLNTKELDKQLARFNAQEDALNLELLKYKQSKLLSKDVTEQLIILKSQLAEVKDKVVALQEQLKLLKNQLDELEQDPRFLAPRATFKQFTGDLEGAEKDLRAAFKVTPDNMDIRAGLMWLLIAAHKVEPLKQALQLWAGDAEDNDVLAAPFAAGLMSLNRPNEALHWLRRNGIQRQDYLWQMSYADCLDANSQTDLAWQIRRRAWMELRKPEVLQHLDSKLFLEMRNRLAALAVLFENSDGAKRIIQSLLRADVKTLQQTAKQRALAETGKELIQDVVTADEVAINEDVTERDMNIPRMFKASKGVRPQDDARLSATVKELALAYAQNNDGHDLARAWLATRFAERLAKPLSEELALLLEANDRPGLARMLDNLPDLLPMYDRIEAAQRVGSPALAQTFAFDQLARLPNDEQLHSQLTSLTTTDTSKLQWNYAAQQQDALSSTENKFDLGIQISPTLTLTPRLLVRNLRSTDLVNLPNVPAQDNTASLSLSKLTDTGFITATLQQRQAVATNQGFLFDYSGAWARELNVGAKLGINQPAMETSLLHVGGMRSGVDSHFTYQANQRDSVRLDLGVQRYASQSGTFLGMGKYWNVELSSHIRLEYPDIIARAFVSQAQFTNSGLFDAQIARLVPVGTNPANFLYLPDSSTTFGFSVGLGTSVEQKYTRAWRPFAEVGLSNNSIVGLGYDLRLGAAGSVLGNDVLKVHLQTLSNKPMSQQGARELGIQYQWFY